eukprot:CAMPEP_0198155066 /NCGR_PEP_ID=MMETSP1443-20131203/68941_1 /TAXON_ID=186043 /ORGANISM="Entomoneis sp., Strain CCMP2396" /LENGTH=501 /DNA_ID=CAMNT_0043821803 /DNA_START=180 /DNA_END=1685 /DNA_ORIENTATION=-
MAVAVFALTAGAGIMAPSSVVVEATAMEGDGATTTSTTCEEQQQKERELVDHDDTAMEGDGATTTSTTCEEQQKERELVDHDDHVLSNSSSLYPCTPEFLKDYWYDEPIDGYHILCLSKVNDDNLRLTLHEMGAAANEMVFDDSSSAGTAAGTEEETPSFSSWDQLKQILEYNLDLTTAEDNYENFQPWAIFSPEGRRLADGNSQQSNNRNTNADINDKDVTLTRLLENGVGLLYLGGQFLWPGVRVGFERKGVSLYSIMPIGLKEEEDTKNNRNNNGTVTITTLALDPLVVSIEGFLSDDECTHIQNVAEPTMEYSDVVLMDHDEGRPASDFRTSQSTYLQDFQDNNFLLDINDRVASLTRIPRNHQENVQVLRYGLNEKYDHHTDFFPPEFYQNDPRTLERIAHGRRNRIATVFWYLTTVPQGGETVFPQAFGQEASSFQDCTTGLLVKPERGKVIIFYSLLMTGDTDPNSVHGACPVQEGIKWAANKWIWNEPMMYVS